MGKYAADNGPKRADPRYWLYEEPVIYETGKNAIRYWEQAGKLQIATCDYVQATKTYSGEIREERKPGKLAALDLAALEEDPETLQWILGILQGLK